MRPQGELLEATKHAECALAIYQAVGDNAGRARAHEVLGITELRRGRLPQAISALETAQATWRSLGNRLALARTLNNLGLSLHYQGAYAAAAEMFGEAAIEARTLGYTALEACALLSLADVHRDQGALDHAMEGYERGLALARKISSDYLVRYATDAAGQVHRLSGRFDQAEVHALRAIHLSSQPGARQEEGCYRRSLAMVYLARGEYDRARATIEEAVRLLERAGARRDLAHAYFCRARIAHSARQRAELRLTLEALERLLASLGYHGFLSSEAKRALPVIEYGIVKGCAGPRLRALRDAAIASTMSASPPPTPADDVAWAATSLDSREASAPQAPTYRAAPVPLALEARAFGQSRIQCAAQSEISLAWRGKKSKELLFYLLCNPGWLRREQIEAEVWSEASEGQVRGAFHTNVYRLRRALGADVLEEYEGHYRLNLSASMWFDVHEFERCCAELTSLPDSPSMVQIAREALALYRGPFLDDLAPEWAQPIRDRLEALYLDLCLRLGRYRASKGEFEEAETLARRALAVAPYLEPAHELVMVCQAAAGRPAAALHHYGRYAEQLTRELGATPSAAVTAAQERILRGEFVAASR
jgi:DNA-binding SARP family transcriptional activator